MKLDTTPHLVLIGDSIFDNASYVPGEDPVVVQLQDELGAEVRVSLRAVDGDVSSDIPKQLKTLPSDTTHLVMSVGGNDALSWQYRLLESNSAEQVFSILTQARDAFVQFYGEAIQMAAATQKLFRVCTIYTDVPDLNPHLQAPLAVFNDTITQTAMKHGIGIIDLREICTEAEDYSPLSPIEPSAQGGRKIAKAIAEAYRSRSDSPNSAHSSL